MLKNLFGKKEKVIDIVAPMTGKIVKIENVPDQVFNQKMIGDGLAIEPTEGTVVAPFDGEVVQLFPTKHAIGIRDKNGIEVLIHIGMETVALNGDGFESYVKQGDQVKLGQKLIAFNIGWIKDKAESLISPVVITNLDKVESFMKSEEDTVTGGESVLLSVKTVG